MNAPASRRGGFRSLARLAFLVVAMTTLVAPLSAQRRTPRAQTQEERARLEERFRQEIAQRVKERLGLSDAESAELSAVVRAFESRRRDLARRESATRRDVAALLERADAREEDARAALSRVLELRREEAALFGEEQAALLEVLTPLQLLRLQEIRSDLGRRIRELRGRDGEPSSRRRPGGPAPFGPG